MWISRYVCLFIIYSCFGWVYETLFCTVQCGKWEDRGFLFGPVCPIYGTGAVGISVIMNMTHANKFEMSVWKVFVICIIGSALLEYLTSWTLEKLFHAVWWDYSNLPLNINGRVSFFTSLGFGFAGLLVVYYIAPSTEHIMNYVSPLMMELLALILVFLLAVDITLTVTALLHFDRLVERLESNFNNKMEMIVDGTINQSNRIKQGLISKGNTLNEQISSLSGHLQGTVRRIKSFRYKDKKKESTGNRMLILIKTIVKHKDKTEIKN